VLVFQPLRAAFQRRAPALSLLVARLAPHRSPLSAVNPDHSIDGPVGPAHRVITLQFVALEAKLWLSDRIGQMGFFFDSFVDNCDLCVPPCWPMAFALFGAVFPLSRPVRARRQPQAPQSSSGDDHPGIAPRRRQAIYDLLSPDLQRSTHAGGA